MDKTAIDKIRITRILIIMDGEYEPIVVSKAGLPLLKFCDAGEEYERFINDMNETTYIIAKPYIERLLNINIRYGCILNGATFSINIFLNKDNTCTYELNENASNFCHNGEYEHIKRHLESINAELSDTFTEYAKKIETWLKKLEKNVSQGGK